MDLTDAKRLNNLWHSRLPRVGNDVSLRAGLFYGAEFDGLWYAVAIWTPPVARALPRDWLELRRLAIAPDAPKNTASRMLAVMARLIRGARPDVVRLASYQDTETHTGGIYKAAGWVPTQLSEGDDWTGRTNRGNRNPSQSTAAKQRWEKVLHERTDETGAGAAEPGEAGGGGDRGRSVSLVRIYQ